MDVRQRTEEIERLTLAPLGNIQRCQPGPGEARRAGPYPSGVPAGP